MYCELHCHSHFSLLDGASSPEALVERAVMLGLPALALTDHDGLYGVVPFWRAAQAHGLHPVIGAEVTLDDGCHLTLLAETQQGYANLCRLLSSGRVASDEWRVASEEVTSGVLRVTSEEKPEALSALPSSPRHQPLATRYFSTRHSPLATRHSAPWPGKQSPRLGWDALDRHSAGLVALTGCRQGPLASALLRHDEEAAAVAARRLRDLFGPDHLFVELQRHLLLDETPLLHGLVALARRLDLPLVATNNVHTATRDAQRLQDVLVCIRHLCALEQAHARGLLRPNAHATLKSHAEMARLFAGLPEAIANTQRIAERCQVSLDFSGQRLPAFPVSEGHTPFSFLYDLCQQGLHRKVQPVTPDASRQLARELDVIEKTGLAGYFLIVWDVVRFAQRQGIRYQGRGSAANSLVAYLLDITPVDPLQFGLLFERFLSEDSHTMPDIDIDFDADRREEVIQYVYRRYGPAHTGMVCNINTFQERSALHDVGRALGLQPDLLAQTARRWRQQPPAAGDDLLFDLCQQIKDAPRHLSIHVGGMLITAQPLNTITALERATMPGRWVVQWDKEAVEDAGLIKIDLLGLRTLSLVAETARLIETRTGQPPPLDRLPLDDAAVYDALCRGDAIGAFQVESRAQSQMLPRLRPRCFADIVVEVAIVRPRPIQGQMVHPYLRRRQGLEEVSYPHPALEPILSETLGIILFQEQVLRVAMAVAGFSGGEADQLRRAMSRQRSQEEMKRLGQRFVAGGVQNGLEAETAAAIFGQLAGFATYGFCKSHAAAFALLSYQTMWLKLYHPAEFYCALLNHQPMGFYQPSVVVGDAQRHGVVILPPDLNRSQDACTLAEGAGGLAIRLGLRYIKGAGPVARRLLVAGQPFQSLRDLCRRTRLPRPVLAALIRAGALDDIEHDRRRLLWELKGLEYHPSMFDLETELEPISLPALGEAEALAWSAELLGMTPGDHPLRLLRPYLQARGVLSAAELEQRQDGEVVRTAGQVVVRQSPPTAKGHLFITLEDETGLVNLVVRPALYQKRSEVLCHAPLLTVVGRVQRADGACSLLALGVADLMD